MVGSFSNIEESHYTFLPPQASISMEIHPSSLPHFTLGTSQDISNPKSASRASSSNVHRRRRGMGISQIWDSKPKKRKLWYLVEWKGFSQDSERSTWEPAENLKNCPELVKHFQSLYPDKPGPNSSKA
ncbi:hypothetical protein O181_105304 [Austropuccinia psidii MF-1]|uniref:Chromo domain-containing protein n=1 Tax=Austropuccinia psidii MF-1 TaxID=1389203 RepID=A0A9Q3JP51_9BASI|nr:hypothetical protein [Austropuccinia psidii MF-1]